MRLLFIISLGCLATACRWNGPPHPPASGTQAAAIVGTWQITDASLRDYRSEGLSRYAVREAHRLEFRADGTCSLRTVLGGTILGQPVDPNMPCTWRFATQRDGPGVSVRVEVRPGDIVGDGYTVGEESSRLVLWNYITDPDAHRYAKFEKSG